MGATAPSELVLPGGDHHLEHLGHAGLGGLRAVPDEVATPLGKADQGITTAVRHANGPDQVQANIDQLLGREVAALPHQLHDAANARLREVTNLPGREVDPLDQDTSVDPLLAGVPALDGWRVQQLLTNVQHSSAIWLDPRSGR